MSSWSAKKPRPSVQIGTRGSEPPNLVFTTSQQCLDRILLWIRSMKRNRRDYSLTGYKTIVITYFCISQTKKCAAPLLSTLLSDHHAPPECESPPGYPLTCPIDNFEYLMTRTQDFCKCPYFLYVDALFCQIPLSNIANH